MKADSTCSKQGPVACTCEYSNEHLGSTTGGKFLALLRDFTLWSYSKYNTQLKVESTPKSLQPYNAETFGKLKMFTSLHHKYGANSNHLSKTRKNYQKIRSDVYSINSLRPCHELPGKDMSQSFKI